MGCLGSKGKQNPEASERTKLLNGPPARQSGSDTGSHVQESSSTDRRSTAHEGGPSDAVTENMPQCLKAWTRLLQGITCLVIMFVIVCLIVAYAKDLDGGDRMKHIDHNTCDLEVDAASARRISHLINHEEVKLIYLDLRFPYWVDVNKTSNIFKAYSMVWTFGDSPGTKHFLDLPLMYVAWSFGLLDHYTFRDVKLTLRVQGSDPCSLVLGTDKTTRAIVKALRELTINITREQNQIDKDLMYSSWCQTYIQDFDNLSLMKFAKVFRFYYSHLRYMCSQLDFNFSSDEYEVVTDEKFRLFNRQWSWLAFVLSIICLWFFPLTFSSENKDQEIGITFVDVLMSPFQNLFTPNCCWWLKAVALFLFLYSLFPCYMIISLIINDLVPEAKTMLYDEHERGNVYALYTDLSMSPSKSYFSEAFPLLLYLVFSVFFLPFVMYLYEAGILFPYTNSQDSEDKKTQLSLLSLFPWFYVSCNVVTKISILLHERTSKYLQPLVLLFTILASWLWVFSLLLVLFKSLMFLFLFFTFCILSVITFPNFMSGMFIYIIAIALFTISRVNYPRDQYNTFLAIIIEVTKKYDVLKGNHKATRDGNSRIHRELFDKLVDEHKPMIKMFLKLSIELVFVVSLLIWTTLWIRDLNQWGAVGIFKDIFISGIIYNIPNILHYLFSAQHDSGLESRLSESILLYLENV